MIFRKIHRIATVAMALACVADAFSVVGMSARSDLSTSLRSIDDDWDPNSWVGSDEVYERMTQDWEDTIQAKNDGSFWSDMEEDPRGSAVAVANGTDAMAFQNSTDPGNSIVDMDAMADTWLDTLATLSAEETQFNMQEAERADKARQMEEWGFEAETIANALDVAVDDAKEADEDLDTYRQVAYLDANDEDVDWNTVESHTQVERDPKTGDLVRLQMVYVDEHACIGCTNCAMVAQSTFRMDDEHGRARVFQQWGDDDETIAIAIETCPVDCIHYVPYDELVKLEVERREQNINFKARLAGGDGDAGGTIGNLPFTRPQEISGNASARCNNCPSRGCGNCPLFGVGKNPEFEKREQLRLEKRKLRQLKQQRENEKRSADL